VSLEVAVLCSFGFALTNGFHDASNAIATLVATRGARPAQAITVSAVFNMLGALLFGTAVASTIAGIVTVSPDQAVAVVGSGVLGAALWNLATWWRGLPSSSGHALVGGLVGAAIPAAGLGAVRWGGLSGWRPVGVFGALIALAVSPAIGLALGAACLRLARLLLSRSSRRVHRPVRALAWGMTAALSFSHGANDAQKAMGVTAALLVASGHLRSPSVPLWVKLVSGAALTLGTAMGGWRIVRTIGRRIIRLGQLDGLASQTASTVVILASSWIGAPVSTTHVVAASVVGVGAGRQRWHHIRWAVVRSMGFAWLATLPAAAALGAVLSLGWRALA
jgi:inorganic phosphate transporter, PiT family